MSDYSKASGLGSIVFPSIQKKLFSRMEEGKKSSIDGNSTRAVWARMVSGVQPTADQPANSISDIRIPVSMFGGVSNIDGNLRGGFDQIYGRDNINFGQTITGFNDGANEFGERFIPMAGITSISTTTEGELGALRKAKISWQCWSLEQLEFFERYFMKLATTCMIEFGWSTGIQDDYTLYDISTFEKAEKSIKDGVMTGRKKVMDSGGEYEVFSGLISNYTWSTNSAGGFDCETELMSHGEPMISARTNDAPQSANSEEDPAEVEANEQDAKELEARALNNLQKYLANIDEEMDRFLTNEDIDTDTSTEINGRRRNFYPPKKGTIQVDIRGWGDGLFSGDIIPTANMFFVTWGWMEDNILSKYMGRASKGYKMKYTVRSRDIVGYDGNTPKYESVKVSCHPVLLQDGIVSDARIATIPDNNPLYKGYAKKAGVPPSRYAFERFEVPGSDGYEGYLRNILINTNTLQDAFADVNTLAEGFEKLFVKINDAFFGIFDFKISVDYDNPTNIKIIDAGFFRNNTYKMINEPSYHELQPNGAYNSKFDSLFIFPSMNAKNNIVTEQSMESKIPSEGMYAAMAGANRPSKTPDPQDSKNAIAGNVSSDAKDGITDKLLFGFNIPDAFSTNSIYGLISANVNLPLDANSGPPITKYAKTEQDDDWYSEQAKANENNPNKGDDSSEFTDENGRQLSKSEYSANQGWWDWAGDLWNSTKRSIGLTTENALTDDEIMSSYFRKFYANQIAVGKAGQKGSLGSEQLIPLEVSFTIDGIAGIFPGNTVHTQFIPKKYRDKVALIIKNVEHELSPSGWTTKLGTIMIAAFNRDKYGDIDPQSKPNVGEDSSRMKRKKSGYSNEVVPLGTKKQQMDAIRDGDIEQKSQFEGETPYNSTKQEGAKEVST